MPTASGANSHTFLPRTSAGRRPALPRLARLAKTTFQSRSYTANESLIPLAQGREATARTVAAPHTEGRALRARASAKPSCTHRHQPGMHTPIIGSHTMPAGHGNSPGLQGNGIPQSGSAPGGHIGSQA